MREYPHPYKSDSQHIRLAAKFEVEFENVFHLKELYKHIFDWTKKWGFKSIDSGQPETLYMELVGGNGAKNHHIWWRFIRDDSGGYFRNFLKIDYQTLNMNSVEIMHNGKKAKTNNGDIILRVEGWLMLDYKEQWKKHAVLKYFDKWFVNRWYKKEISAHKKELWFEVYNLQDEIKQYLELHTPFEKPVAFRPNKGLP